MFPPCCLTKGQTIVEVTNIMELPSKGSMQALRHSMPPTLQQARPTHASIGDSWTLMGKSGSVSYGVIAPTVLPSRLYVIFRHILWHI